MGKYAKIENGYIMSFGVCGNDSKSDISEEMYADIMNAVKRCPRPSAGKGYRLRADTLAWEEYDLPQEEDSDEISAEDALEIISGGEV